MPNLVVEASYVGNRGVWWTAPELATINYNSLTPQYLMSKCGLNVANPADAALLYISYQQPSRDCEIPAVCQPE
jgi:hypothetical protein